MDLGEAVGRLTLDATGFTSEAQGALQTWNKVKTGMQETSAASGRATGVLMGLGVAIGGVLTAMTLTAARTEAMRTSLYVMAKNAGLSKDAIDAHIRSMKALGITTQDSIEITANFIQSELSLADAMKVARVAQDMAVIAGKNSSEAANDLTTAIVTQNPLLLRQFGILTNTEDVLLAYGKQLGIVETKTDKNGKVTSKWSRELTTAEKRQAFVNRIMEEGAKVAGVYETAMQKVGKRLTSFPRYIQEASNTIGEFMLPIMGWALDIGEAFLKSITPGNIKKFIDFFRVSKELIAGVAGAIMGAMVPALAAMAISIGKTLLLLSPWIALFALLGVALGPIVQDMMPGFKEQLQDIPNLVKNWREEMEKILKPVQDFLKELSQSEGMQEFRDALKNFAEKVLPVAREQWEKFEPKLREFLFDLGPKLADFVNNVLTPAMTTLLPLVEDLAEAVLNLVSALASLFSGDLGGAIDSATDSPLTILLNILAGGKLAGMVKGLIGAGGGGAGAAAGGAAAAGGGLNLGADAAIGAGAAAPVVGLATSPPVVGGALFAGATYIGLQKVVMDFVDSLDTAKGASDDLREATRMLDQAEVELGISLDDQKVALADVEQAQKEVDQAQKDYNQAIKDHGKNSDEAKAAYERLQGATDTLKGKQEILKDSLMKVRDQQIQVRDRGGEVVGSYDRMRTQAVELYKDKGLYSFLDQVAARLRTAGGLAGALLRKLADIAGFDYSAPPIGGGGFGGGGGGTDAAGGVYSQARSTIVGEAGTEAIINLTNPKYRTRSMRILQYAIDTLRPEIRPSPLPALAGAGASRMMDAQSLDTVLSKHFDQPTYGDVHIHMEGMEISSDYDVDRLAERLDWTLTKRRRARGDL